MVFPSLEPAIADVLDALPKSFRVVSAADSCIVTRFVHGWCNCDEGDLAGDFRMVAPDLAFVMLRMARAEDEIVNRWLV